LNREILGGWFSGLRPEKVVYAVNCGSNDELTDMLGITYQAVCVFYPTHQILLYRINTLKRE
jgi:hypothetical protein